MDIFAVGLAIIIAGWIVQLYKTSIKKDRDLSPYFLLLYAIGVSFLCIDNFLGNDIIIGILNTIIVILAAILLIIIQRK